MHFLHISKMINFNKLKTINCYLNYYYIIILKNNKFNKWLNWIKKLLVYIIKILIKILNIL